MGVKVVTSYWNHETKKDEDKEYLFPSGDSWNNIQVGERYYLEIVDTENGRVVAQFDGYDHVSVVDDEDD